MGKESGWKKRSREETKEIFKFGEDYKHFLDAAKTEREATAFICRYLTEHGFADNLSWQKAFFNHRNKQVFAFIQGKKDLTHGLNIIAAHIDAPRLDLKQNPLYEDVELALLRTHYYGGIKKYQWVAIPLALHGVVVKIDGTVVDIVIGENETDPVFVIDDLLPHLSRKSQDVKSLADGIEGEKLVLLFGSMPLVGEEKEPVKKAVLKMLSDTYGIGEEDFISAELEAVPAFKARDVGIDRSLIGAYGQDDRASAYALLRSITEIADPERSCLAIFTDKEEIGSEGNTSMRSHVLQIFLYRVLEGLGMAADEAMVKRMLFTSRALSADVNAALNPSYQDLHEKQNACYLGRGIGISKYTGSGGKSAASDANAEFIGEVRRIFARDDILWQAGEIGKIDEGGGGTVAKFLAAYGMDILDCGPALLAMHSPYEISSKFDMHESFRAFKTFFKS
ncbi:MAG TPA: aminopeptidase [Syntrophorhabdaceae bacterium]|jgi:aspartyl aminopeptidase